MKADALDAAVVAVDGRHVRARIEVITTRGAPNHARVFLRVAPRVGR
ncbi:hypothetical protein [Actinomadura kijaniata]|nr:hypothetical protein [Actinomadura kijaniata]